MAQGISISIPIGWDDRSDKLAFAIERDLGLEITSFLGRIPLEDATARRDMERRLARELEDFSGPLSYHGAFADLSIHSLDLQIAKISRDRIERDLHTAMALGCEKIVFHTGFNPLIPRRCLLQDFMRSHCAFWSRLASEYPGLTICLENQWEPEPELLVSLLDAIAHPSVRACVDVAHAHAFSAVEAGRWIDVIGNHTVHMHLNDNFGNEDSHLPVGEGSIDWREVADAIHRLPAPPTLVIELQSFRAIAHSLEVLGEFGLQTGEAGCSPFTPP